MATPTTEPHDGASASADGQIPPHMTQRTVRTRICIISDTHNAIIPLPKADILIHCGDISFEGRYSDLAEQVEMMRKAPAELKLVIAGNHDITLDREYYLSNQDTTHGQRLSQDLDKVRELFIGPASREVANLIYLEEGVSQHILKSSGARFNVYASPYQPEHCNWAFAYERHEDRFNPPPQVAPPTATTGGKSKNGPRGFSAEKPVPDFPNIDLMITHGPPLGVLDRVIYGKQVGCEHLRRADTRARPLLHCFGHIHEGRGALRMAWNDDGGDPGGVIKEEFAESPKMLQEHGQKYSYWDVSAKSRRPLRRGDETLFVNASIMNVRYRPTSRPWVIDIDLPVGGK